MTLSILALLLALPPAVHDGEDEGKDWCAQAPSAEFTVGLRGTSRRRPDSPARFALRARKILPVSDGIRPVDEGVVLVRDGKIEAVGKGLEIPSGYEVLEFPDAWVFPGFVDLHSHIQGGGAFQETNDMSHPTNPELRVLDAVSPWNEAMQDAVAAGVTTILAIPGSGTNLSGFGVLLKLKNVDAVDEMVLRDPGAMKIAQAWNPERGAGDLGASRMGETWMMHSLFRRMLGFLEEEGGQAPKRGLAPKRGQAPRRAVPDPVSEPDPVPPDLRLLADVFRGKTPVLIHTAGARDVMATARMFHDVYGLRAVVSHGCFNGMWVAPELAARGLPTNLGPRNYDWTFQADARFYGVVAAYAEAGCPEISINTDASVVPQEELFLQGAMSARFGADLELCLRACTLNPARSIGVGDRIGSLDPGKDADFVVKAGPPFDVRTPIEMVVIDGEVVYERSRDGQRY